MSTYNNYIGMCSIKISIFLAEHSKTKRKSGFGELPGIINCLLRNEAVDKSPDQ